jgi:hypothetical protein
MDIDFTEGCTKLHSCLGCDDVKSGRNVAKFGWNVLLSSSGKKRYLMTQNSIIFRDAANIILVNIAPVNLCLKNRNLLSNVG